MISGSSLVTWTSDDGSIRMTSDGRPSIIDMIKVLGGQKAPHKVWERLTESQPEVLAKCQYLKFPGPGQRETPVARDKEAAYYILGLLPGAVGRKYREQAAKLFTRFLENPGKLVSDIVENLSEEEQQRIEARLKGIRERNMFTDALKENGVTGNGYGRCTDAVYVPILGATAHQMKIHFAGRSDLAVKKINPRDHMTIGQLTDVGTAERISAGQLSRSTVAGNPGVERVVRVTSQYVRNYWTATSIFPASLSSILLQP